MVAKKPGKEEKKDVLVVGQDDLCVSLWWDIKVAQVVFGPKFSFRAWNLIMNRSDVLSCSKKCYHD